MNDTWLRINSMDFDPDGSRTNPPAVVRLTEDHPHWGTVWMRPDGTSTDFSIELLTPEDLVQVVKELEPTKENHEDQIHPRQQEADRNSRRG